MLQLDTKSYWIASESLPSFPPLDRDVTVDVGIIGGGITGITAAYLLKKAGKRVALIERRRLASIDTGHTTAHVTYVTDLRLTELEKNFGRDDARAAWDSGRAALWQIDSIVNDERIACDFQWINGCVHTPVEGAEPTASEIADLEREAQLAEELGFQARFLPAVPFVNRPGVEFEDQAVFHPRKYLHALAAKVSGDGSYIFEQTDCDEVRDEPLTIMSGGYRIRCDYLIVATHNPLIGKAGLLSATLLQTKLALYSSYAVGGKIPSGSVPHGSYWDTNDPYLYLRVDRQGGGDFAILGGEDHKTGQTDDAAARWERLERHLRKMIPGVDVSHRWSGQVIETSDGLPYIGETAERQFIATGFSGNGMTYGTLASMMAADTVSGRRNPWKDLFDPARKKIKGSAWDYLKENKDYPYYLVRDRFAGAEGRSLRSVRRGEARILNIGGKSVAAYRDEHGIVTAVSAVCTHMGCLVAWNDGERTWDCPCHGSRFDPAGRVIAGPAESPLPKAI